MTGQTLQLLDQLRQATSRTEVLRLVTHRQEALKHAFEAKGLKFQPENSHDPQGFLGGQRIRDRDYAEYQAYNELNFIRHGLTTGWYDRLDDQVRFHRIQEDVKAVLVNLP